MIQIAVAPEVEVRAAIHRPRAALILVRRRMTTKTKIRKSLENSSIIVFSNLTWSFKYLMRLKSF